MVFSSLTFLYYYLPATLLVMKLTPRHWRNAILFLVSLLFYGWGEPRYIVIMLLSTVVDYFNGLMVYRYRERPSIARRFVIASVVFNLGMLGFFKYYDFIVMNLNSLGFSGLYPLGLTLPLGISFYTFQTMSYPIDVYRKDAPVQKKLISFGAYVSMFPQLIAGPIVRYKDIAKQLNHRLETEEEFAIGIERFMIGLAKKVLLANSIGYLWTEIQQFQMSQMSVATAWLGIIAFAFQIYYDFSGYSDMAIGLGKMMGFTFPENFNFPYVSKSITEFWRRWHISLGQWFKDYVYIPLGGSRTGSVSLNLFAVWFLTGLWHGASWNFIFWGLYFFILILVEKKGLLAFLQKCPSWLQRSYTLFFVLIGWVLFNFTDMIAGVQYLSWMFKGDGIPVFNSLTLYYLRNYAVLWIGVFASSSPHLKKKIKEKLIDPYPLVTPVLIVIGLMVCTAYLVDATYNPFLYFRF